MDFRAVRVLAGALVLTATVGCTDTQPPLRVGVTAWPSHELAALARERGWLPADDIRFLEYQSPAELTRAFRNELLDVVFVTSHISLRLADRGVDHRIVYVLNFSDGGDALVAKPGIESLAGLKGRAVGVESSALGAYVLHRALAQAGLSRSDVETVPLDVPKQVPMWRQDRIHAVVCYEPQCTRLAGLGGRVLFDSRAIPREVADVVLAQAALLEHSGRRRQLQVLVRGLSRAAESYRTSPEDAVELMAQRQALSVPGFRRALSGMRILGGETNRSLLGGESPRLRPTLEVQARILRDIGIIRDEPGYSRLLEGRFVCPACLQ